jgi:hypothetical protein
MGEMSDARLPLDELVELYRLAPLEAEIRVIGRHLAAAVRAGVFPPGALAAWDQFAAGRRQELGIPPGGKRRPSPPGIDVADR